MAGPTPFQVVFALRDSDGRGWSEKVFVSAFPDNSTMIDWVNQYANLRMACSTSDVTMTRARVGSVLKRSPNVVLLNAGQGVKGTQLPPSENSDVAVLARLTSANFLYNRIFMRGVPDEVVDQETFINIAGWALAFEAWGGFLFSSGFALVKSGLGASPTMIPIVSAGPNSPKGITIILLPTIVLTQGQVIRIHGSVIPGYNGLRTVTGGPITTPSGNKWILSGANPISTPPASVNMWYTNTVVNTAAVNQVTVEGISVRKVGRPFGVSPGRARTLFSQRPSTLVGP